MKIASLRRNIFSALLQFSIVLTLSAQGSDAMKWQKLPARPLINLEPNYEEIRTTITDKDVRNACYWSLFATPIAGITYGANGIWPWLRPEEKILNHSDAPWTSAWDVSINLPGSIRSEMNIQTVKL